METQLLSVIRAVQWPVHTKWYASSARTGRRLVAPFCFSNGLVAFNLANLKQTVVYIVNECYVHGTLFSREFNVFLSELQRV